MAKKDKTNSIEFSSVAVSFAIYRNPVKVRREEYI